jgi:hypothetical protein
MAAARLDVSSDTRPPRPEPILRASPAESRRPGPRRDAAYGEGLEVARAREARAHGRIQPQRHQLVAIDAEHERPRGAVRAAHVRARVDDRDDASHSSDPPDVRHETLVDARDVASDHG